jgi:GxxExxY protein
MVEDNWVDEGSEPDPELNRISKAVIGAAIEVHRVLGPGYLESVYQKALEIEFRKRGIVSVAQHPVVLHYKGELIGEGYLDFLVGGKLIVELKAVEVLAGIHTAQVISYLKATNHKLGLLLNFNVKALKDGIKRIAL